MKKMPLPRCTPESQGISSAALLRFVEEIEKRNLELHSLMLLRHGAVVAEGWWRPYAPERPHMLFSLTKSFTSTAVGLAAAEGRLSLDDPVISFFSAQSLSAQSLPAEISENLRAMRVRQLLTMSTGHTAGTLPSMVSAPGGDWVKAFLALPVEHKPGTHFMYNTGASYMLSAIVQKVTGLRLLDYLKPRLLDPLGITGATCDVSPQGIHTGGWGMKIKTEDIARFGLLYLQMGRWNRRQLIPEAWVREATARQVSNGCHPQSDFEQGYGYQFWRCRHNVYRADGSFGQFSFIMPDQGAVLATTSGTDDMQGVMNTVWEYLLPEMSPAPLPRDPGAARALEQKLAGLALPLPNGTPHSPLARKVSGRAYRVEPNELAIRQVSFDFAGDQTVFHIRGAAARRPHDITSLSAVVGEHSLTCGLGQGYESQSKLFADGRRQPVVAHGVWTAEDTFTITLRLVETPFCITLAARFTGEQLEMTVEQNVRPGPGSPQVLKGISC